MKKAIQIVLVIILVLAIVPTIIGVFCLVAYISDLASGKDTVFYFEYDELWESLEKAEIIYVEDFSYGGTGKITVIKSLEYDEMQEAIKDLSEIQYVSPLFGSPPEPNGYCIRLWYKDGTNQIYGASGTTARWAWCVNIDEFDAMINKYID